jgi:hypothetical protein
MADDLTRAVPPEAPSEAPPALPAPPAASEPVLGRREPQYGVFVGRFRLAYALLAIVLGAAVGGLVVLLGDTDSGVTASWSSWKPEADGNEGAKEIAEFVQHRYRLSDGAQLVAVIAGEPTVQELPVNYFAIQRGSDEEDIKIVPAEDSIAYQLCGLGQRCAVREGRATEERGRLLRREALELALYTFKYVDEVDNVVAYLPPRPGATPTFALFFQKDDLDEALDQPLERTLPHYRTLSPERLSPAEGAAIDQLVGRNLFQYSFQQAPDGSAVLVLAAAA